MTECGDYLAEQAWDEGFTCSLPAGHDGPHRAEGGINDVNTGTDIDGRAYTWVYEWEYKP
jgi:hypothetical protein